MVYSFLKNDQDGFYLLSPKAIFRDEIGVEFKVAYESEFAYYTKNIYKKIEKAFPNFEKYETHQFINKNLDLVLDEVVYVVREENLVIALKHYWELDAFADGELGLEDYEDEQQQVLTDFQIKITCFSLENKADVRKRIVKLISKKKKINRAKPRQLHVVCHNSHEGLFLSSFQTNHIDISIEDNYNDDFLEVSNNIINRLSNKKDNGIVLLHSDPGAGKTSYLRYLTQQIKNKRLIYLPPDMAHRLSDPDFMTFLMGYPNSVLLIEDAESCLKKREGGGNQAVANLLNSSDGLLGDALKLQILCTFNCPLGEVDPALLRPGRLIAEYRFEKLSVEKCNKLLDKIFEEDSKKYYVNQPTTLAELYNLDKKAYKSKDTSYQPIGFRK